MHHLLWLASMIMVEHGGENKPHYLNCVILTRPVRNLATTSSSPPSALTIFCSVETCMSACCSSFDKLGCLMPRASASWLWLLPLRWRNSLSSISDTRSWARRAARSRVFLLVVRLTSVSKDFAILITLFLSPLFASRLLRSLSLALLFLTRCDFGEVCVKQR